MAERIKPTAAQVRAAHGKRTVPDLVGPGLAVLFVGINPGLYSGATGHHFAKPGNRFWPALHLSGLTPRRLEPWEERGLLACGVGISKLVTRATATAAELTAAELKRGGQRVKRMARALTPPPRAVCFLGIGSYTAAYQLKRVAIGRQDAVTEKEWGGPQLWVLPNPSGLNANHQLPDFVRMFTEVREAVGMADARIPMPSA